MFQWLWLSAIVKTSSPLDIDASIPVRETTSTLEPGIFGIFSPTLLMPAGIASHLAPAQLDAILAHELCHWRRRDNLTAAIHMLVEVLFWFHPLVWWLGGRLVVERERACDESVIQSGRDRETYAEGILKVCQHYVELPSCAAGVSGGLLRKRIEDIMTNPILSKLPIAKRCLLSFAALIVIAAPIALGMTGGAGAALAAAKNSMEIKHYRNEEWKFELDIPKQWIVVPPVQATVRKSFDFIRKIAGSRRLDRLARNELSKSHPEVLQRCGSTSAGQGRVLEFRLGRDQHRIETRPDARLRSDPARREPLELSPLLRHRRRQLRYVLGFGTSRRDAMFDTFDRVAKSFVFEEL